MKWRKMNSAPKDGTFILLHCKIKEWGSSKFMRSKRVYIVCAYDEENHCGWMVSDGGYYVSLREEIVPTLWTTIDEPHKSP